MHFFSYYGRSPTKYYALISGPIGDKLVTDLPGIGPAHGKKLSKKGFYRAEQVLHEFLRIGREHGHQKQRDKFVELLMDMGVCRGWANECSNSLDLYCRTKG